MVLLTKATSIYFVVPFEFLSSYDSLSLAGSKIEFDESFYWVPHTYARRRKTNLYNVFCTLINTPPGPLRVFQLQCKKNLDLVLIYNKTVRARKSTQGKNKIQKNKVNSPLNTVNKMNSRHGKLRKSSRQNKL